MDGQAVKDRLARSIAANGRPSESEKWKVIAEACRHATDAMAELQAEAASAPNGSAFRHCVKRLIEGDRTTVGLDALHREADMRANDVDPGAA